MQDISISAAQASFPQSPTGVGFPPSTPTLFPPEGQYMPLDSFNELYDSSLPSYGLDTSFDEGEFLSTDPLLFSNLEDGGDQQFNFLPETPFEQNDSDAIAEFENHPGSASFEDALVPSQTYDAAGPTDVDAPGDYYETAAPNPASLPNDGHQRASVSPVNSVHGLPQYQSTPPPQYTPVPQYQHVAGAQHQAQQQPENMSQYQHVAGAQHQAQQQPQNAQQYQHVPRAQHHVQQPQNAQQYQHVPAAQDHAQEPQKLQQYRHVSGAQHQVQQPQSVQQYQHVSGAQHQAQQPQNVQQYQHVQSVQSYDGQYQQPLYQPAEAFNDLGSSGDCAYAVSGSSASKTNPFIYSPPSTQQSDATATSLDSDSDDDSGLTFKSLTDAQAHYNNYTLVKPAQDDWQQMEANPIRYIKRIIRAFNTRGIASPRDYDMDVGDQTRFQEYQQIHFDKVANKTSKDARAIETAAWMVFKFCIDAHKLGIRNMKSADRREKCSLRFTEVAQAIEDYTIIRWDLIRGERLEQLANDPVAAVNRKICNFTGNSQKKKREENNAEKCEIAGVAYAPVLGKKRKSLGGGGSGGEKLPRKRPSNFPRPGEEVGYEEVASTRKKRKIT